MFGKVLLGKSFLRVCEYVCQDPKRALVLKTEGVRNYDHQLMAADFEMQRSLRPGVRKAVFHGILSFYPGTVVEDVDMLRISADFLAEMKLSDTQYAIVKHTDKKHLHMHLIANMVNNRGEALSSFRIGWRVICATEKINRRYGLREVGGKDLSKINFEALNRVQTGRYIIYGAIMQLLPECKNLQELSEKLANIQIGTRFRYGEHSAEITGISFSLGNLKYRGSGIDKLCSVRNLEKQLFLNQLRDSLAITHPVYGQLIRKKNHAKNISRNLFPDIAKGKLLKPELQKSLAGKQLFPVKKIRKKGKSILY